MQERDLEPAGGPGRPPIPSAGLTGTVRTRLGVFLAVLVLAAAGAWGAGRAVASQLPVTVDPLIGHHFPPGEVR